MEDNWLPISKIFNRVRKVGGVSCPMEADLIAMGEWWAAEDLAMIASGQDPKGLPIGTQAETLDAYWGIMKDAHVNIESRETAEAARWAEQLQKVS